MSKTEKHILSYVQNCCELLKSEACTHTQLVIHWPSSQPTQGNPGPTKWIQNLSEAKSFLSVHPSGYKSGTNHTEKNTPDLDTPGES